MKEVTWFESSKWLWIADNHKETKKTNDFLMKEKSEWTKRKN